MRRSRQVMLGAGLLVTLQVGAWAVYRIVEGERTPLTKQAEFQYEQVNGLSAVHDIPLERDNGQPVRLRDYTDKPVLLHFWATWCVPCLTEIPTLLDLADDLGPGNPMHVLLVSVDEDWKPIRHFFDGDVPRWVLRAGAGAAKRAYAVGRLPETYILGEGLVPLARIHGPRDWRLAAVRTGVRDILAPKEGRMQR